MSKKVAVLAVNPVNGSGLFQYLETFFEKGISYKVFAVSDTKTIRTNSGIPPGSRRYHSPSVRSFRRIRCFGIFMW